ncbi:MAG: ATP-binding protein [Chlamydiota bacterium]|jgi:signal transduction histidine kinase
MSDSLIEQLQQTAEKAVNSESIAEGMQHLAKAFSLFSQEAARLKQSYEKLQEDFQSVNKELSSVTLYLETFLKNISQGIIFVNKQKIITLYNEAAQKILKVNKEDILFKSFNHFFPDDFFGFSISNALNFGLSQKETYLTLTTQDKEKIEIEIFANFVHKGPTDSQGIILLLRDVTEVQQLQLIANRNNRLKELGEMAAAVAHEIRNPIGGIRGYATLLYRDLEKYPEMQEMATHIISGTKSLEKLVTTILHYSRPVSISPKTENMVPLIKKLAKHIKVDPNCPENISVDLHISSDPLLAPIDADAIYGVLLNLVMNAYQSMTSGGKIILSLMKRDLSCVLTVSDTGKGIETKDFDKIFSPFFTTKKKGNGLGLSEVQKIIHAHNGKIDVHSQLGKGTTFTIILPLRR